MNSMDEAEDEEVPCIGTYYVLCNFKLYFFLFVLLPGNCNFKNRTFTIYLYVNSKNMNINFTLFNKD